MLDFDNRLLYVTGFGIIIFITSLLSFVLIPLSIPHNITIGKWESTLPHIFNILMFIFSATAFVFYLAYVGKTVISLYIIFKIALVCLIPLIILIILSKNKSLEINLKILKEQNNLLISQLNKFEKEEEDSEIEILSDSKSDNINLKLKEIILIKSADNYIEIYFLDNGQVEKKLIRNTLKGIEVQLEKYNNFIRCHRTGIVNILYIEKLARNYSGYYLKVNHLEETIPVSRQYLQILKKAIVFP